MDEVKKILPDTHKSSRESLSLQSYLFVSLFLSKRYKILSSCTHQKNAHGKIIILYDNDERLASQAATTMCERGFENVFMLSGGKWGRAGLSEISSRSRAKEQRLCELEVEKSWIFNPAGCFIVAGKIPDGGR